MSACCSGAPDTQSSSLTGRGWLASAGTLRRLLRHFYRGVRCGGVVVSQQFIGQVPDWIDPETTGVPFEKAADHFGARPLFEFVSTYFPSRINDIGTLSFSDVLTRKPQEVQSKWWTWRDVEMPFLLRALISGDIRAFGALDRADASTVWIPPRLWKDLQPDLDNKRCFSGAGATYWNVRVVDPSLFSTKPTTSGSVDRLADSSRASKLKLTKLATGLTYKDLDAPLVEEAMVMLRNGGFNVWQVARHLAPRAAGSLHGDSRAKRLHGQIKILWREEQAVSRIQGVQR